MRLLIITQKVDGNDPVLGFFHRWIEEFAKCFEVVIVICLEKGQNLLPANVKVLSLGKEEGGSKFKYFLKFYEYIWSERSNYDVVFVHMNQEYVLLGWEFWKCWGKRILLWRNHARGNLLTNLAVMLSDKVFCTSSQSYTARFRKTQLMPAGVDTDFFRPDSTIIKKSDSILFLGRIAPVKKILEFVDWLGELSQRGEKFSVTMAGEALLKDFSYDKLVREKVSRLGLNDMVKFIGPVTQNEAKRLYQFHQTYVNFTPSGSLDKTILEAAACETSVIVRNTDLKFLENLKGKELRDFVVEKHSLKGLVYKFQHVISQ